MKRVLSLILCLMMFSVSAVPALACRHHRRTRYGYTNQARYRRVAYARGYSTPRRAFSAVGEERASARWLVSVVRRFTRTNFEIDIVVTR